MLGDAEQGVRSEFRAILDRLRGDRPIVLAASTHAGEEALIATAIRNAGGCPIIIPRHAERRATVGADLPAAGFCPILRTAGNLPEILPANACYVADTTGELRDWTQLADIVIIGKSFLAKGGQNPVEAIAAKVPVIFGPDMTNFADLVTLLNAEQSVWPCEQEQLAATIKQVLTDKKETDARKERAYHALRIHSGATNRSIALVDSFFSK